MFCGMTEGEGKIFLYLFNIKIDTAASSTVQQDGARSFILMSHLGGRGRNTWALLQTLPVSGRRIKNGVTAMIPPRILVSKDYYS